MTSPRCQDKEKDMMFIHTPDGLEAELDERVRRLHKTARECN
jgi:hypothetical protein